METKELRVVYVFDAKGWALTHGGSVMVGHPTTYFDNRKDLVDSIESEGYNVDFAGYLSVAA